MSKRKIENEIKENEVKVNEIKDDVDTDTLNENAENISEMELEIYGKTYKVSELIELRAKEEKTYLEKETVKRFVEVMINYYRGIKHAILKECCGKTYTLEDVKKKLNYDVIDRRCSRKSMRFDKVTVDTILSFMEQYENE